MVSETDLKWKSFSNEMRSKHSMWKFSLKTHFVVKAEFLMEIFHFVSLIWNTFFTRVCGRHALARLKRDGNDFM